MGLEELKPIPREDVIAALRELLESAESGEVVAIAVGVLTRSSSKGFSAGIRHPIEAFQVIGAMEFTKLHILGGIKSGDLFEDGES